jgi:hypothetical protein
MKEKYYYKRGTKNKNNPPSGKVRGMKTKNQKLQYKITADLTKCHNREMPLVFSPNHLNPQRPKAIVKPFSRFGHAIATLERHHLKGPKATITLVYLNPHTKLTQSNLKILVTLEP